MNILDIGIIFILIMFLISGFKKGFIKETVSFVGLVIIFVIAFIFKEHLGNIFCKYLPFFEFGGSLKGLVSINILLYQLLAFLLIYSVLSSIYMIALKLSGILQKLVNLTIVLLLPSKLGGAIVSFLKAYIVIFAILLVMMIPLKDNFLIKTSKFAEKIVYNTPVLSDATGSLTKSVNEIYTLGDSLAKEELTVNVANLETIDIMLKYKVVDKETIEQLIVLDKLDSVVGLNKILEKY